MSRNLLSLLLALCAALAAAENSDVIELDADNFHSSIDDKDLILVEFYAPWYVCDRLIIYYVYDGNKLADLAACPVRWTLYMNFIA